MPDLTSLRYAAANPRTDQYGGSGLGLYISKKLIELHRGFIGESFFAVRQHCLSLA